jgi:dolichyl-diphosphooligosaccharide--protein glycosyltransferase
VSVRVALALFGTALAVRLLPWPLVFGGEDVVAIEPDAYYHLRRILYSVVRFPELLTRDPYVNFPQGGEPIWTPVLDWSLAALARLVTDGREPQAVERLVVWAPPLLGATTVLVLYALARRRFGAPTALLAGLLLALLPGHFWFSQLGFVDHHVAATLATTGVLLAGMRLFEEDPAAAVPARRALLRAGATGAAMGAAVLVWPGCLLHVGILQGAAVWRLLAFERREAAIAWARLLALAHATAAAVVLPLSAGNEWIRWGSASPVVLSNFQPLWFALGAASLGLLGELWQRAGAASTRIERALSGVLVGGAVFGAAMVLYAEFGAGIADALAWFLRTEAFQAVVGESTPLFWTPEGFERSLAERMFTRLVYAVPLLLTAFALAQRGRPGRAPEWLALGWSSALFVATLIQHRFMDSFSVVYALLLSWSGLHLYAWTRRRLPRHAAAGAALALLLAALVLVASLPTARFYGEYVADLAAWRRGQPIALRGWMRTQEVLTGVARWIAAHTPETAGYLDAAKQPEYGVLAPLRFGHVLRYEARRPVVQDNFGDDVTQHGLERAVAYLAAEAEEQALAIAGELGVRYVVAGGRGADDLGGYPPGSVWARLTRPAVLIGPRWGGPQPAQGAPALARHRLVYESDPPRGAPPGTPPLLLVYEIVAGARVEGRALPGARVEARLLLRTRTGRTLEFASETLADASGRYALLLPYPNERFSPALEAPSPYRVRSGGSEAELFVSEQAVRQGETLAGPALSPAGPGR